MMSIRKRMLFAPILLLVAALACNAPIGRDEGDENGGAAAAITALAATIQAQHATGTAGAGSVASAVTPTVTFTSGPSAPAVTVSQATNCRTGPGTGYDQLGALNVGQTGQIVGKYTPGNYWIINTPGGSGTCWLWGQYATTSGDLSGLPEMVPPPTPTPRYTSTPKVTSTPKPTHTPTFTPAPVAPPAPSNLAQTHTCAGGFKGVTPIWIEDITLTWQDNATNENAYYVYKGGVQSPALPPNSTSYHITLRYDQGTGGALYNTFGVEAVAGMLGSNMPQIDVATCP